MSDLQKHDILAGLGLDAGPEVEGEETDPEASEESEKAADVAIDDWLDVAPDADPADRREAFRAAVRAALGK